MLKSKKRNFYKRPIFWILTISLILALVFILWGDHLFDSLESLSMRLLISFSILFIVIIFILLYKLYFKEGFQFRFFKKQKLSLREQEILDSIEANVDQLKTRFLEATKIIKNSSIYKGKKDVTYELPWYLIIGREKEGKTSLLESSGLDFPLNINYQNSGIDTTGIDRTFKWFFAEHAVFVDVGGQYTHQEIGSVESGVWKAFLKLFKKKRWKRPINGIILTVSVETLMSKNESELEQYAKELRDRFDELSSEFTSTIPIYLFVTKTDHIPGFNDYFATISEYEKDEIFGMMFDDDKPIDLASVQSEFEALIKRLEASVLDRIHYEWDTNGRTKVLLFCDEFSLLFTKLKTFIDTGFTQTRYRSPLMLRGVYFSSIPQETTNYPNLSASLSEKNPIRKGMFITKVLKEIIFPEANVIKMDTGHRIREKFRERIAIAIAIVSVILISSLWVFDYYRHSQMVATVHKNMEHFILQQENRSVDHDAFEYQLESLNQLYAIKNTDDGSFQYFWNLAFFKVAERQETLDELYYAALDKIVLTHVANTLETQMMTNLSNYDITWENTKAYLMLNYEEKRDPQFLEQRMKRIWQLRYPNNPKIQKDLNEHWKRLLEHGFIRYPLNMDLVKIARHKLAGFGKEALLYKQLKDKAYEMRLKDFQFYRVMGANSTIFIGNNYRVPGFYTKEGYEALIAPDAKDLLRGLMRSNWVLGYNTELKDSELDAIFLKVRNFYFADYKTYWNQALNALYVSKSTDTLEISNQMKILASAESPILSILKTLKYHTDIYTTTELIELQAKEGISTTAKLNSIIEKIKTDEAEALKERAASHGIRSVREFFKPYHLLINADGKPTTKLQAEMDRLETTSDDTTNMESSGSPLDAFNRVTGRINGQHQSMAGAISTLPSPVNRWLAKSLGNNWGQVMSQGKNHVNEQYQSQVYPFYRDKLANKYPFNPSSSADVSLSDFEEFFGTGGVIDQFQTQYINPFVTFNPAGRGYQYRKIDGASVSFDPALMEALYLAREIRQHFFDGRGNTLGSTIFIKPHILDKNLATAELEYDDATIVYEHGPIKFKKLVWPANSGNSNAKFQLFNLDNTPVYSINNEGDWAIFRLFNRMQTSSSGSEGILCDLNAKGYRSSFILNGPASRGFGANSPMRQFKLKEHI